MECKMTSNKGEAWGLLVCPVTQWCDCYVRAPLHSPRDGCTSV